MNLIQAFELAMLAVAVATAFDRRVGEAVGFLVGMIMLLIMWQAPELLVDAAMQQGRDLFEMLRPMVDDLTRAGLPSTTTTTTTTSLPTVG